MRRLGRKEPRRYPLLARCEECGHVIPLNPDNPDLLAHFPWCGFAPEWMRDLWEHREEIRKLRTIDPLEP